MSRTAGPPEAEPETRGAGRPPGGAAAVYRAVAAGAFRRHATYRAATVAGAVTNTVFGFILASTFLALWRARPGLGSRLGLPGRPLGPETRPARSSAGRPKAAPILANRRGVSS